MSGIPEPGRERDLAIARRIMDWHPINAGSLPHFSTDDTAALSVLAAMEARGYGWEIAGEVGKLRYAKFYRLPDHPEYCRDADAETLADAITWAALAALEGEQ